MIDLYYWPTPNGHKASIMLEEAGLPYTVHPVNILRGEQFDPAFLAISPNNRIPAIVDREGPQGAPYALFESGAILMYLAEKSGRLLPAATAPRYRVIEWLMFQMAGVGPMFGQCGHFKGYAPEPVPYAIERYCKETLRLYAVLDRRLGVSPYLGGDEYSIADVAVYPWVMPVIRALHGVDIDAFPHVRRWHDAIAARPAVRRGTDVLADAMKIGNPDEQTREAFFGKSQFQAR